MSCSTPETGWNQNIVQTKRSKKKHQDISRFMFRMECLEMQWEYFWLLASWNLAWVWRSYKNKSPFCKVATWIEITFVQQHMKYHEILYIYAVCGFWMLCKFVCATDRMITSHMSEEREARCHGMVENCNTGNSCKFARRTIQRC